MSQETDVRKPEIGSRWVWEIDSPRARALIEVAEVMWNGVEWWVRTSTMPEAPTPMLAPLTEPEEHWNLLSRFWEAVTAVASGQEEEG